MVYFKAWYRKNNESGALDANFPDWVVHALDEEEARAKALESMGRREPEKGFNVLLLPIEDEDEGTMAFASARQNGQALF